MHPRRTPGRWGSVAARRGRPTGRGVRLGSPAHLVLATGLVAGPPAVGSPHVAAAARAATDAGFNSLLFGIGLLLLVGCAIGWFDARRDRQAIQANRAARARGARHEPRP